MIFLLPGNIWVYGSFSEVETDEEDRMIESKKGKSIPNPNYCHPWVYWLAFILITMVYIALILVCFMICCIGAFMAKKASEAEESPLNDTETTNYTEESGGKKEGEGITEPKPADNPA